ncbi:hypothetical protein PF007_g15917 [Phytophthora fragariae]|uniref:Uncharacterized protein n=1 Tax=Phytophthora fragariae TaxID=53985 RepID=A0A6A3RS60_9STRA|nr:hypothetical protein PF007_g15917 [Phytophthora fragariae]
MAPSGALFMLAPTLYSTHTPTNLLSLLSRMRRGLPVILGTTW